MAMVSAAAVLSGCAAASSSPAWDAQAGEALQVLRAQQVRDPAAARTNGDKTPAQSGRHVSEALERHTDSYRSPPQPSTVINVGR